MTPQLQQAIRLLQLSSLELQQEIQQALDCNLMLEMEEPEPAAEPLPQEQEAPDSGREGLAGDEWDPADIATSDEIARQDIPDDMPVDTQWDDIYQEAGTGSMATGNDQDDENPLEARNAAAETLQDHLQWQLNLTPMSDRDRLVALTILDAVEPSGMLNQTIEEIHQGLLARWQQESPAPDDMLELDEVQAVLHRIQQFDPPGIAAQNLQECLLIQLRQLDPDTPWLSDAHEILQDHIELLAAHDYKTLMRKSGIRENTLREAIKLIQSLNPAPGSMMDAGKTEYIAPDVYVYKHAGRWRVELNTENTPRLRINREYSSLIRRADNSRDNVTLKNHLQEARWFIKSLESRNETLLKVTTAIVEHQRNFLEYGPEAMKPLVLHEIAENIGMHESTVSRVTSNKYMHTPQGLFELKYFFSSHVATDAGGECSSTAIRALIKKLVAAENPKKPLSDSKITALLEEQGIQVARRTIAKYREALNIPPSNERKILV